MKTATPIKLRSGKWGARVKGSVNRGDEIVITTKTGKSWNSYVTKIVWSGNGVSLCETDATLGNPQASLF